MSACIGYAILVGLNVVKTLYNDHQNVVKRWQGVVNAKNSLKNSLEIRDQYIHRLEDQNTRQQQEIDRFKNLPPKILRVPNTGTSRESSDEEGKKKRTDIRSYLAYSMSGGQTIFNYCLHPPSKDFSCENEATKWYQRTVEYIGKNLEPSYGARFNSASGLSFTWSGVDEKTNNILNFIKQHLAELEQFIKELQN